MANPNDPIFTIDASQILAKLHLAGQSQVKVDAATLNTGIQNPQSKATPDNLGETRFNLDTDGKYQAGFCRTDFFYYPLINLKEDQKVVAANSQVHKAIEQLNKITSSSDKLKDKSKVNQQKIAVIEAQKKLLEITYQKYAFVAGEKEKEVQDFIKEYEEALKNAALMIKDLKESSSSSTEDEPIAGEEAPSKEDQEKENSEDNTKFISPYGKAIAMILRAYDKENEARSKQKADNITKFKSIVYKDLVIPYFSSFVGKDLTSKIKESDLVPMIISESADDVKDSSKASEFIKDNSIVQVDTQTIENLEKEVLSKPKTESITPGLCFVVGFEVEVETL